VLQNTDIKPIFECPRRIERYAIAVRKMSRIQLSDYIDAALDPENNLIMNDSEEIIPVEDYWDNSGCCSYCGSMKPDDLFSAISVGAEIGPTDKNYKIYVHGGSKITRGGAKAIYDGKFYMLHLNRNNSDKLHKLIEDKQVKIGYPGYFYNGLWLAK